MSNTSLLGAYGDNSGSALMFRNRIINGDMTFSTRYGSGNITVPVSTTTYTTDRWLSYCIGSGATASQVSASVAGHTQALKLVPAAGNTYAAMVQRIEAVNIKDLANSVVTLSGWIYVDNATGVTCTIEAYIPTTIDLWNGGSTLITIANPTVSLTSGSYVFFQKQIALPATAVNGAQFAVTFTGAASKDLRLTGVQLEAGPTATPFERRQFGVEAILCQRYYEVGSSMVFASTSTSTSIYVNALANFKVSKRKTPDTLTTKDYAGNPGKFSNFSSSVDAITNNINSALIFGLDSQVARLRLLWQPAGADYVNLFVNWTADAEL